ncbi:MAG: histone deacetylase [Acidimicrobiia bacterium]|nr:histone deacetylase [Acidimicrobiia bacterium]
MSLLLLTHDLSLEHRTPPGHPERVERVTASVNGLRSVPVPVIDVEAPSVDRLLLERLHDPHYIDDVHAFCVAGGGALDQDTYAVPATWDAALHAAGAGPAAIDGLRRSVADTAFVAVRPPGHHAERRQAMGFCFFNNVGIAAAYLRAQGERVAVVDWDVHHGNGTQHSFYRDPDVLYVSLHEFPFYPGTGWLAETGDGPGAGMNVNVPLPAGTSPDSYLGAFHRIVTPIIEQFEPDWMLISSGFDAHVDDPLGGLRLEVRHYAVMARALAELVPANRTVAFLEGGYDLDAVAEGSRAVVEGSLGYWGDGALPTEVRGSAARIVELTIEALAPQWELH